MSTEPPSRVPRGHIPDTKSAQEDLASKKKVEKVRKIDEIDADERTRKKFRMAMDGEEEEILADKAPNPFDVLKDTPKKGLGSQSPFPRPPLSQTDAPQPSPDLGDIHEAIVPSASYSPPPQLNASQSQQEEEDPLPQSGKFWKSVDMPPDQPIKPKQFQEVSSKKPGSGEELSSKGTIKAGKGENKMQQGAPSPFGQPDKPTEKIGEKKGGLPVKNRDTKQPLLPSPFEQPIQSKPNDSSQQIANGKTGPITAEQKQDENPEMHPEMVQIPLTPLAQNLGMENEKPPLKGIGSSKERNKEQKEIFYGKDAEITSVFTQSKQDQHEDRKGRDQKGVEIQSRSTFSIPASIAPFAASAATAATPYLHPSTMNLFTQMVGTMFVMTVPPGISRTEIVLNSPSFASSKFYGSTITIEKYATAPDSFNIRLTGTTAAVVAFKENIPSLMTAFQNSSLPFRVQRIEAEFSTERPVFRRKEREDKGGEAGGGDMGERRNQ